MKKAMVDTIKQAFDAIIEDRVDGVAYRTMQASPEYQEIEGHVVHLFDQLNASLTTDEQKRMLDDMSSAMNTRESLYLEYAYRQGLKDSQELNEEFSLLGIANHKEGGE